MISTDLQQEVQLDSISYSQLSKVLSQMDSDIFMAIFYQLLNRINQQSPITKQALRQTTMNS
ncbi:hypothetical protein DOK76_10085 [Vagococcus sp. DIV0080]|uniref:Uncharacterized protein n=1 Tax=Candidatus Vagococcus giribetii TaxID=2230876 RepID=A0ABS3HW64_9ENTE|nr:hypothetical protein [Vagococcus sp. DIV0080]MBO0477422.1 hypothetical protein [Vagococcus sp. DIV0080]